MKLYTLLKDRASINILKILSDNELVSKKYTMNYTDLRDRLMVSEKEDTLIHLQASGLVAAEQSDTNGMVLSITQKGKDFVSQFDKLIEVLQGKQERHKSYSVEYDLTDVEQKMLVICMRLKSETDGLVDIYSLAAELYPMVDITGKVGEVSKNAKRLEGLNLLVRIESDDETYFDVTETGERVVSEQLVNIPVPEM